MIFSSAKSHLSNSPDYDNLLSSMQKQKQNNQIDPIDQIINSQPSKIQENDRLSLLSQIERLVSTKINQYPMSDIYSDIQAIRQSFRASIEIVRIYPSQPQSPTNSFLSLLQQTGKQTPSSASEIHKIDQISPTEMNSPESSKKALEAEEKREQQFLTIVLVLSAPEQISEVECVINDSKIKPIPSSKFQFKGQFICISVFKINPKEIYYSKILYKLEKTAFLVFSKTITQGISLQHTQIRGRVGILMHSSQQKQKNLAFINFCLLQAHQYLAHYLSSLKTTNENIIKDFYELFLGMFDAGCTQMEEAFRRLLIDDRRCTRSEYFLYLIYLVYRQKAGLIIQKYHLLGKLRFNSESIPRILQKRYYQQFQNSHCLKDFLLYTIMRYAVAQMKQNHKILVSIAKACISNLNQTRVAQIFTLLSNHPVMIVLLDYQQVNRKFIENKDIPFIQYLLALLQYTQLILQKAENKSYNQVELMASAILGMLKKINLKAFFTKISENSSIALQSIQKKLFNIFSLAKKMNVLPQNLGEFYVQIKFILSLCPALGEILLRIVKPEVVAEAPRLLQSHFRSILYPLIMLPEQKEESKILLNHFFQQKILDGDFISILQIVLLQENHLYNHQAVRFVVLKYIGLNPSFQSLDLKIISDFIGKNLKKKSNLQKLFIAELCQLIIQTKKDPLQKQYFSQWWSSAKLHLEHQNNDFK